MPELKFQVGARFQQFLWNLKTLKSRDFYITLSGWGISFLLVLFPFNLWFNLNFLFYVLHVYFWFRLIEALHTKLRPPCELLVGLFFLFYHLEAAVLHSAYATSSFFRFAVSAPGSLLQFAHILLLSALILFFSLVLAENSKKMKGVLVLYAILALIGIQTEDFFYLFILQVILFILLLRRTTWLESLTKAECWVYLVAVFLLFQHFSGLNPFQSIESSEVAQANFWYGLPRFLYLIFKIYLLAVLVKIPIVLVYNFASLSRKLKFSSLFQSTFPQLIQLAMLGLIFYFFIAGWQAEKMRKAMVNQMDEIIAKEAADSIETYEVTDDGSEAVLRTENYEPVELSNDLPEQGILALNKRSSIFNFGSDEVAYFLFFKSSEWDEDVIHFARIEPNLLHLISQSTSILAGSRLLAYPYQPPIWESYLYRFGFWKQESRFRIFPFALRPQTTSDVISVPFEQLEDSDLLSRANDFLMNPFRITIGRVIAPMINDRMASAGFFAFEILLIPDLSFFSLTFAGYLLFLAFVYLLINLVVIRRMSKFGSEINQMIVQKFNQLKNGIREISTGNLNYKVRIEGEDEFVELAHHFNEMGDRLKSSIAEARDKERLQQELTIARNVQLGMLPRTLPNIPGYQLQAMLKTANEVGGDFYDVLKLNRNKYLFTIGDVSGKSTSAAFYMAQCISLIRYSQQFTNDPREIVLRLNKYFSDPLVDRQIFVTAIVGILDIRNHSIRFVRAGHNLPILVPGQKSANIKQLQSKGLGLGLERVGKLFEENIEETSLELAANDVLVFYTDGLVEASRDALDNEGRLEDEKEFYGEERLLDMLDKLRGQSASEIYQSLTEDIQSFYGARSPVDDYTLLVIQKSDESSD